MPAVTVGIPAYKARHLGQAIASVLAQTYADFELLVSDDCPDDSVRQVVERFHDPRLRLIEGPRRGLVPNSVHIWENASGDLLKFVYDDDFLLPFGLSDLVELVEAASLTFAFCARYIVDDAGRILQAPQPIARGVTTMFEPNALPEVLLGRLHNPIGEPSNVLIRRSAFADASCLSQFAGVGVRHNIDVAFYLNAAERGRCAGTPKFGAAFRQHANQATALRTAPAFAYAIAEWELFVRGGVSRGLVGPHMALKSFPSLAGLYEVMGGRHVPELEAFVAALPELRARLEAGERDVLDEAYLARFAAFEAAVAAREAAQRRSGDASAKGVFASGSDPC